ncbi:MAG: type IX secretion system membrane protein PorP/SprF [Bacteroidales bacterium]|jgi:type IX secretion system PorP/SprF family membrane protein|nr:type IX secretion system membrane protein PorP/SprF [Bacteroidales bacterium]
MNTKIKIIAFLLSLTSLAGSLSAQEYTIYNQYHFHNYLMNPASAGAAECTHFMLTHKQQWIGLKDAPNTQILSFQTRMRKGGLGLGAYLFNDKNGYSYQQGAQVTVAYHIPMSRGNRYTKSPTLDRQLSFGVSGKFYRYQIGQEVIDHANNEGENIQRRHGIYPNANVGVFFQDYNFFAGLSVTNLIPIRPDLFGESEPIPPLTGMLQLGYAFDTGRDSQLEPSVVYKMDINTRAQLDFGLRYIQHIDSNDLSWWAGIIAKQNLDSRYKGLSLMPHFTVRIGKFRVGYALSLDLNRLISHSYATHELMLGYSLCSTKKFCR